MKKRIKNYLVGVTLGIVSLGSLDAAAQSTGRNKTVPAPACRSTDFRSFLEWNMRSTSFDKMSVAPTVVVRRGSVRTIKTRAQYKGLPIALMDNSYVTTKSIEGSPRNWENVRMEINQAQDGRVRVDWVKIRGNRVVDEESISPDAAIPYGPEGYLLFRPTANCWQLTDDVIGR
jgi:hypothetical protein